MKLIIFQHFSIVMCVQLSAPRKVREKLRSINLNRKKNEAEDGIYVDTFTVMILLRHPQKKIII